MKPANTLVVMDEKTATKYHPIITDLGGAVDLNDTKFNKYPRVITQRYFSAKPYKTSEERNKVND